MGNRRHHDSDCVHLRDVHGHPPAKGVTAGGADSYLIAAALLWRHDHILLVHQQGPDDPEATWGLPGGVVVAGDARPASGVPAGQIERGSVWLYREQRGLQTLVATTPAP